MSDAPTEFEILTAMGFRYFAAEKCDAVVLEVGLGGRLDATNVIPSPEAAVITNIGLEHTAILGHTLPEIAREKAGIIKPGHDGRDVPGKRRRGRGVPGDMRRTRRGVARRGV